MKTERSLLPFTDVAVTPIAPALCFLCAKQMTPIMIVACFWCSFADSECAFCAGRQLRLRMLRSGMMQHGAAGGPCARCAPFLTIGRLLAHYYMHTIDVCGGSYGIASGYRGDLSLVLHISASLRE